jgi:hypothetical protein
MGTLRIPLACAIAAGADSCGPDPQQQGQLVLIVAPLVFIVTLGIQWILLKLWERRFPEVTPRWSANLFVMGALTVASLVTMAVGSPGYYLIFAFWMFGTSYAAVLLLTMRIWMIFDKRRAFTFAHLVPLLLYMIPAATLAVGGMRDTWMWRHSENFFTLAGFLGYVPGGIFLLLLIEALIRGRKPLTLE